MSDTLKLVLTDHWFDEIKSGRKSHEYRRITPFWIKRLLATDEDGDFCYKHDKVEFQRAYRKNPERMTFEIKDIRLVDGKGTDLHIDDLVFDIELGERIK